MAQMWIGPQNGSPLQAAVINTTSTGNNTLISAATNQIIRVFKIFFVVGGTTNITMQDGASTALTGAMPFVANGAFVLDNSGTPWFTSSAGNAIVLNQSGAVQISGAVYYTQNSG